MHASRATSASVSIALSMVPVPFLSTAFEIFKLFYSAVKEARGIRSQMLTLAEIISGTLQSLNKKLEKVTNLQCAYQDALEKFTAILININDRARTLSKRTLFSLLITKHNLNELIVAYKEQIATATSMFRLDVHLENGSLIRDLARARTEDHIEVVNEMAAIKDNQQRLFEIISETKRQSPATITEVNIREKVHEAENNSLERSILEESLRCIQKFSYEVPSSIFAAQPPPKPQGSKFSPVAYPGNNCNNAPGSQFFDQPITIDPEPMSKQENINSTVPSRDVALAPNATLTNGYFPPAWALHTDASPPAYGTTTGFGRYVYDYEYASSIRNAWNWNAPAPQLSDHEPIAMPVPHHFES